MGTGFRKRSCSNKKLVPPAGFEPASTGLKDRGPVPLDEGGNIFGLERAAGIEPATDGLEDRGSASELYPHATLENADALRNERPAA